MVLQGDEYVSLCRRKDVCFVLCVVLFLFSFSLCRLCVCVFVMMMMRLTDMM